MDHTINIKDLPPIYQTIAKIIGIENAVLLGKEFCGTSLYLPKLDRPMLPIRDRKIMNEYTGDNVNSLAKKYGLTRRRIYDIIRKQRSIKRKS